MHEGLRKLLDAKQVEGYLARIGLSTTPEKPSVDYLDRILRAQLRTVPFDCADVWAYGTVPSLAVDDLYDKIITRKRGGYCFELNGLFVKFLQSLGFDAYEVIVHLARPELNGELNNPSHCAVIVTLDGKKRFCDVGYGGPVPDGSVPFGGEEVLGHMQSTNGVYTVVNSKHPDGSGNWYPRFTFKDCPCDPAEILPINFFIAKKDGSPFAADLKLNLRMDNGFAEFGDQVFKYKKDGKLTEERVEDPKRAAEIALEYFDIPNLPTRDFGK